MVRLPLQPRIVMFVRGLVLLQIVASTEIALQPVRWWRSPRVVSSLRLTPEQSMVVDEFDQSSWPAQWHASEDLCELTTQIDERVREGNIDDQLLHLTEKLAEIQSVQREQRGRVQELASRVLSPQQFGTLRGLVRGQRRRSRTQ